jgi:hypothetical protein
LGAHIAPSKTFLLDDHTMTFTYNRTLAYRRHAIAGKLLMSLLKHYQWKSCISAIRYRKKARRGSRHSSSGVNGGPIQDIPSSSPASCRSHLQSTAAVKNVEGCYRGVLLIPREVVWMLAETRDCRKFREQHIRSRVHRFGELKDDSARCAIRILTDGLRMRR